MRRPTSYKQLINGPAIILNYNIWQYAVQVLPTGTEIWLQSILFMSRFLFFLFGITEGFILKVLFFIVVIFFRMMFIPFSKHWNKNFALLAE